MKTVLHLTTAGAQLWCKSARGWQAQQGPASGPVWVLTDLAEEAFAELTIPRIFGRDRQAYVARQLAARFPDTRYRTVLGAGPSGGLMERIAPPRQPMLGIDAAARIDAALGALDAPLVGVWATSMLLAQLGAHKALPAEVFVVLPGLEGLRIVVVKDRVPVLSRLVAGVSEATQQVAEIVRTLRHLENTRVLERGERRHGVLVLGDSVGLADLLLAEHMDSLPWTVLGGKLPPQKWPDALFDLVVKSPSGQLAPLENRITFVASQVRHAAYGAASVCVLASMWASADNLSSMWTAQTEAAQARSQVQQLLAQGSEIDRKMAGFGVSADVVRRAVALDAQEVASAPSLDAQMRQLAQAVDRFPGVHVTQLGWQVLAPGRAACPSVQGSGGAPPDGTPAPAVDAEPASRLVELSLEISLPENLREKAHIDTVAALSDALLKLDGARLLRDPAQDLAQAAMTGGGASFDAGKTRSWCLSLPGARSPAVGGATLVQVAQGMQRP